MCVWSSSITACLVACTAAADHLCSRLTSLSECLCEDLKTCLSHRHPNDGCCCCGYRRGRGSKHGREEKKKERIAAAALDRKNERRLLLPSHSMSRSRLVGWPFSLLNNGHRRYPRSVENSVTSVVIGVLIV